MINPGIGPTEKIITNGIAYTSDGMVCIASSTGDSTTSARRDRPHADPDRDRDRHGHGDDGDHHLDEGLGRLGAHRPTSPIANRHATPVGGRASTHGATSRSRR